MPAKPSAAKRARQNSIRRARNRSYKSVLRTAVKKVETAIASGEREVAQNALLEACSRLDRTASKGVIHPNKAARNKSRLTRRVSSMA